MAEDETTNPPSQEKKTVKRVTYSSPETPLLYSDGIYHVVPGEQVVKMWLRADNILRSDEGPAHQIVATVAMPLKGFARTAGLFQAIMEHMTQTGEFDESEYAKILEISRKAGKKTDTAPETTSNDE